MIEDVTITVDDEQRGPVVPDDFAGLSFERQALFISVLPARPDVWVASFLP
jgi:hypothetical protein